MAVLIPGPSPASREVAESIARTMGARLVEVQSKTFPDGERYVRIQGNVKGEKAYVVHTLSQPQGEAAVEAMLLADAALGAGASSVGLIAPYMAYSRQDKRFLDGEPVSIRVLLKALSAAGYSELVTVEIHKPAVLSWFPARAVNVSPYEYMAGKIKIEGDPLILAPDAGALERAMRLAKALGAEHDYLVKHRDRVTGMVRVEAKNVSVKGRPVILVDDIVSTGGTIAEAARLLSAQGATRIYVLVAHALLVGNSLEKLEAAGVSRIIAANTLPRRSHPLLEYVDIGPLIAGFLPV